MCPYCHQPLRPEIQAFALPWVEEGTRRQLIWPSRCGCLEESEALAVAEREREAAAVAEQARAAAARLQVAGLVGWLAGATFDTFEDRDDYAGVRACRETCERYVDALIDGDLGRDNWMILHGGYGTGKTHLAAAIVRRLLGAGWGGGVYFRVWTEYLKRLQASWDGGEERTADIEEELSRGRLVVLDDVDKRRPTGWTRETLFTALNRRYNAGLPTVLTFNHGPDDMDRKAPGRLALEEYLGRASLDRILEVARVVEFDGPSYRSGVKLGVR